jgi:hypothetical protein
MDEKDNEKADVQAENSSLMPFETELDSQDNVVEYKTGTVYSAAFTLANGIICCVVGLGLIDYLQEQLELEC